MKKNILIICCLISLIILGCGTSELITPTLTPTPTATSTPAESPEEIITNAVNTACQMIPADSSTVGVSIGGEAVARVCPNVDSEVLPEEWKAKTPGDLHYVVAAQNITDGQGRCGPYIVTINGLTQPGVTYVDNLTQVVVITLINAQTGKFVDSAKVEGPPPGSCPSEIQSTSPLMGDRPTAQDVQKAVVDLISNQLQFSTLRTLTGCNDITDGVESVAFSPDGKLLASALISGTVVLWDVASGQRAHTLTGYSVAFSPDGKLLASESDDGTVKLWDVASGQEVRTLTGVSSVAFSPDGKLLALVSDDTMKLWDVASGQEVRTLNIPKNVTSVVAFSPDGKLLAFGSRDAAGVSIPGVVELYDVATGQEVQVLTGHTDLVSSVAFSPDGKLLASGSFDQTVKLWDVASGQEVRTLKGNTEAPSNFPAYIFSVAFSPDGKLLASGSRDYTVTLWDVASGQLVRNLTGRHILDVTSVAFSPDGKLLASGSWDCTVTLTDVMLP